MHFYFYLCLSTIISFGYSCIITLKLFEINHPNEYNNLKFKMLLILLRIHVFGQALFLYIKNTLCNTFLKETPKIKYNITFINKGIEVFNIKTDDFDLIQKNNIEYDIILYHVNLSSSKNSTNSCEEVYFFTKSFIETQDFFNNIKKSGVKLLAPQIKLEKVTIPIKFKDEINIFYEGNLLFWKNFAKWYITYINPLDNSDIIDMSKYSISFIDNQMNTIELNHNEMIVFNQENYDMIKEENVHGDDHDDDDECNTDDLIEEYENENIIAL